MKLILSRVLNYIRQKLDDSTVRQLALIFGSVFFGFFLSLLIQNPICDLKKVFLIVLVFLLFLAGMGLISKGWHWVNIGRRKTDFRVAILNDIGNDKELYTGTDIDPQEWKEEIDKFVKNKEMEIEVDLISAKNYFDKYNAIINPYGGVYPEYDLRTFKTMDKIIKYIREGGLFVNVAEIPCYFACDPSIKPWRKIESALRDAPYAYQKHKDGLIIPIKRYTLFALTPFTKELGVDIYKVEDYPISNWSVLEFDDEFEGKFEDIDINVKVHRVAIVKGHLHPIIKPKEEKFLPQEMMTPLFFVKYGDGKLLSSLIFENKQERRSQMELKKLLAKLVIDCIQIENKK